MRMPWRTKEEPCGGIGNSQANKLEKLSNSLDNTIRQLTELERKVYGYKSAVIEEYPSGLIYKGIPDEISYDGKSDSFEFKGIQVNSFQAQQIARFILESSGTDKELDKLMNWIRERGECHAKEKG